MNKTSTPLLIIFLCAVILGLAIIVVNNKNQKTINLLNEEINKLNSEVEIKKQKEESTFQEFTSNDASASSQASASSELQDNSATASGLKE